MGTYSQTATSAEWFIWKRILIKIFYLPRKESALEVSLHNYAAWIQCNLTITVLNGSFKPSCIQIYVRTLLGQNQLEGCLFQPDPSIHHRLVISL